MEETVLGKEEKTFEETIDYVRCMTITKNVPADGYFRLTPKISIKSMRTLKIR